MFCSQQQHEGGFLAENRKNSQRSGSSSIFSGFLCGKGIVQIPYRKIENILRHATLHLGPKFVYLWKILVKEM